jgi:hypothetical protein
MQCPFSLAITALTICISERSLIKQQSVHTAAVHNGTRTHSCVATYHHCLQFMVEKTNGSLEQRQRSPYSDYTTDMTTEKSCSRSQQKQDTTPQRPDRPWGLLVLLPTGKWPSFHGVRLPGWDANHSPPLTAESKSGWSLASTHPHAFEAWVRIESSRV